MKENKVAKAIGRVDDKYIDEAINYKSKRKSVNTGLISFVAIAASLMLVVGAGLFQNNGKVDTVVSIDINPSIELMINKHNKVVSVVALNEDAEIVLDGMDLKNVDLDTALNAIMGSLLKHGYLDEVYNSVNVCVENDNEERATQLGEKIAGEIDNIFDENDLIGGVNTQLCTNSDEMKELAESYGVSVGKFILAQTVSANTGISLDVTVNFSIEELWDLLDAGSAEIISKEEALKIAVGDAQVQDTEITLISDIICETDGVFTYVIKFSVGESKMYKYEISATDGTILEREYEYISSDEDVTDGEETDDTTDGDVATDGDEENDKVVPNPPEPIEQITKHEALAIVYSDAGVAESDVKLEELKHKPIEKEYHIEFSVGLCDYVYVINAVDGSIVKKEVEDRTHMDDTAEGILPETIISADEALALVLELAGVEFEDLTKCDIKYTYKKESAEYKIHFHVDKEHYEYIVNAVTGEVTEKTHPVPVAPAPEAPLPHEKEDLPKPEAPTPEAPVLPHEKEDVTPPEVATPPEVPTPPKEPTPPETPTPPAGPTPPKAPTPPAGPHENEEPHAKPEGPDDTKVTITFIEDDN